jgi:hypothetical protein
MALLKSAQSRDRNSENSILTIAINRVSGLWILKRANPQGKWRRLIEISEMIPKQQLKELSIVTGATDFFQWVNVE